MHRPSLAWLGLPILLLAGGCPVYVGDGDPGIGPRTCDTDRDCPAGFDCIGGVCERPDDDCRTDGDLPPGEACIDGEPRVTDRCTDDGDCGRDEICDYRGTCVPRRASDACRGDADCGTGEVCVEGLCVAGDDTCQFDFECPPGRACVNQACVPLCADADDCPVGSVCEDGFCVAAEDECARSTDCPAGASCVDGRCLEDCAGDGVCEDDRTLCASDEFCRPDASPGFCDGDEDCEAGSVCVDQVCRVPCPTGTDAECQAADFQLTTCSDENLCLTVDETTAECRSADDCAAGQLCANGQCR